MLKQLQSYASFLEITAVSKKDIRQLGEKKTLAVDNTKLRENLKANILTL
jgi:hypothetical protein